MCLFRLPKKNEVRALITILNVPGSDVAISPVPLSVGIPSDFTAGGDQRSGEQSEHSKCQHDISLAIPVGREKEKVMLTSQKSKFSSLQQRMPSWLDVPCTLRRVPIGLTRTGATHALRLQDILIVAPSNARWYVGLKE